MGEILKALLASRIGQIFLAAILIIAAGSIVSVLVLLWRVVGRGSTLDLWGLTISSTTTPTSQEAKTASSPGKTIPSEKNRVRQAPTHARKECLAASGLSLSVLGRPGMRCVG
jgi:hypothetical protein